MAENDAFQNPKFKIIIILAIVSCLSLRLGIWLIHTHKWFALALYGIPLICVSAFFMFFVIAKLTNRSNNFLKRSFVVLIACLWIFIIIHLFGNQFGFHQLIKKDSITVMASEKEPKPNEKIKFAVIVSLKNTCAITSIVFNPDVNKSESLVFTYDGVPGVIHGGTDQNSTSRKTFQYSFTGSQNPKNAKILIKYETIKIEIGGYRIIKGSTDWLSLFPN